MAVAAVVLLMPAQASEQPAKGKTADHIIEDGRPITESATVTSLIAWIVAKTGWTTCKPPPVVAVPRQQLVKIYKRETEGADGIHVDALYSSKDATVYISDKLKLDTLRGRAVLLHELVHHVQAVNKVKLTCPAESEKKAYELTFAWLRENGVDDPYSMLDIDPRLVRMMSHCPEF